MNLCRLCLSESFEGSHNMYGHNEHDSANLGSIVSQWFQIDADDPVSTVICSSCWKTTLNFHLFCCKVMKVQCDLYNDEVFVKHLAISAQRSPKMAPALEPIVCAEVSEVLEYMPKSETCDPIDCKLELDTDVSIDHQTNDSDGRSDQIDDEKKKTTTTTKRKRKFKADTAKALGTDSSDDSEDDSKPVATLTKPKRQLKSVERANKHSEDSDDASSSSTEKPPNKRKRDIENLQIRQFCNMFCDLCPVNFETFTDALKHYSDTHKMKGYLMCCDRKLKRRNLVVGHIQIHLDPDAYRCKICDKKFSGKHSLRNHMDIHKSEDQKPLQCDLCPKKYARFELLSRHKFRSHCKEEDKVFVCDVCKKKFLTKSQLTAHIKHVHNAVPEICDYCGKEFKGKNNLNVHRNEAHMGPEITRLQCNVCGVWLRETYLAKHIKWHNAKVETCTICSKVLQNKKSLNNHMRNIHGNRVFQCAICDKTFPKPLSLKEHMALHTGEDLYKCPYCTKTFKSGGNMHAHRKKAHFNDWEQDRGKRLVDGRYQ